MNQPDRTDGAPKPDSTMPDWRDCDAFCINAYSGNPSARCGWRGRLAAVACRQGGHRVCPRCGGATLLPIPEHPPGGLGRREG